MPDTFSVTYKTKSSCANLEGKRICHSLWKTRLKLRSSPNGTFWKYTCTGRGKESLLTVIFQFYFAFPFCFQIEFQC